MILLSRKKAHHEGEGFSLIGCFDPDQREEVTVIVVWISFIVLVFAPHAAAAD
jgi:hypothetical protein